MGVATVAIHKVLYCMRHVSRGCVAYETYESELARKNRILPCEGIGERAAERRSSTVGFSWQKPQTADAPCGVFKSEET